MDRDGITSMEYLTQLSNKMVCKDGEGKEYFSSRFVSSYNLMFGKCASIGESGDSKDLLQYKAQPNADKSNKGEFKRIPTSSPLMGKQRLKGSENNPRIYKKNEGKIKQSNKMERECVKIPTIYEVTECDKKISCFLRNVMPPIGVDGKKITERDLRWIRMTRDSYSFITFYKDSKKILDHIKENYLGDISMKTLIATDLTAHIGGDVLAFASEFKFVEAVEIDDEAYDFLKNNINVYGFENVSAHFEDSVRWIAGLEDVGDIVFMDPPWGGSGYRKNRYMKLSLSGTGVEDIAIELMQKPKPPMLVVLKLPMNYDMKFLKKKLSDFSVESVTVGKLLVVFISAK